MKLKYLWIFAVVMILTFAIATVEIYQTKQDLQELYDKGRIDGFREARSYQMTIQEADSLYPNAELMNKYPNYKTFK